MASFLGLDTQVARMSRYVSGCRSPVYPISEDIKAAVSEAGSNEDPQRFGYEACRTSR